MNNTMNPTQPIHPSTSDAAFFRLISEIDRGRFVPNQSERRTIEWARFADRLRAIGYRITIGAPG